MTRATMFAKAQALYYSLREMGLSHSLALKAVIDFASEASASMPKVVPPAKKPARKSKGGKG